ncbi:hypothetical protein A3A39_01820 [Candidatus Kaiserbacteria bacterium RIFCSPLOWO2_01_FULL_54_13]|uniref:Glycosyltransferase 2-like domain-containing protein n=1 Tax=Candidatus Kaiserbacteria bacterium RIFCSPLOWO2_01_FULL_54_13 TaxID=1798512 RepID=A0A1F6F1F8_9BACT|nr:MAG: hypothetical protein A3A39_01820 [Candidatus Kaiserbacteria bacterium RIFCSPLOWO2_01_FULL_54_13]
MFSYSISGTTAPRATNFGLRNFFVPARREKASFDFRDAKVCAIVPTYKPGKLTEKLVEDLVRWTPNVRVYVVDDSTPRECEESVRVLARLAFISERVTMLRTPVNKLKAGALNYALEHIWRECHSYAPDVVLTLDDDIVVLPMTVENLVTELMTGDDLGAVCSQCHVLNKNANLLTRLQGLEYLGFNATRLADDGFFRGPLVMHGMLTAFRASALHEAGGFAEGHLIEDYEVTARLKAAGWSVKSALNSHAWTVVPESFSKLWKQRTRWSYGGITVVDKIRHLPSVLQDLIGHGVFWATVCMIDLLILSIVFKGSVTVPRYIPGLIIMLSLLQLVVWYGFQLWLMRLYKEKDVYDWLIRVSLFPEFIYSNMLTFVLIGSYFFLFFNTLTSRISKRSSLALRWLSALGGDLFRACGYTKSWGTRN